MSQARVLGQGRRHAAKAAEYRIAVKEAGAGSRVSVQSGDGKPEQSEVATRILTVLLEDLK